MNVPFDPISSVAVPALSILISAGIAILVVYLERRAARRDRLRVEVARLTRELTTLQILALNGKTVEAYEQRSAVSATLNALGTQMSDRELPVVKFLNGMLHLAEQNGNAAVTKAALFSLNAIEAWSRGKLSSKQFAAVLPTEMDEMWAESVKLSDWSTHVKAS